MLSLCCPTGTARFDRLAHFGSVVESRPTKLMASVPSIASPRHWELCLGRRAYANLVADARLQFNRPATSRRGGGVSVVIFQPEAAAGHRVMRLRQAHLD